MSARNNINHFHNWQLSRVLSLVTKFITLFSQDKNINSISAQQWATILKAQSVFAFSTPNCTVNGFNVRVMFILLIVHILNWCYMVLLAVVTHVQAHKPYSAPNQPIINWANMLTAGYALVQGTNLSVFFNEKILVGKLYKVLLQFFAFLHLPLTISSS